MAKNIWWRKSRELKAQILSFVEDHKEIASCWVVGRKFSISPTTVWKILKEESVDKMKTACAVIAQYSEPGWSNWQRIHACWSTDVLKIRFMGGWIYLQLLLEERSRLILGWKLSAELCGENSRDLIKAVIARIGMKPLVVKHDRGSEFINYVFLGYLEEQKIISLASPAHWAPFNGRMERTNRLVRRFTRLLERSYCTTLDELISAIERAVQEINDELPRRMFGGLTSREIYDQKEVYTEAEREYLVKKIFEEQERIDGEYFLKGSELDRQRQAVLQSLQRMNVCEIHFGVRVNLLQEAFVS
jgi:hypothetical protein